ncbi:MAG: ferritin-like domain-containing protein [Acidobacteriaceae bacterium]|nr:ferritin-like domain-containing protein [Acidobacteriaceae bacterium]
MKDDRPFLVSSSEANASDQSSVESTWRNVVKRRTFLHGLGAATAALPATALFAAERDPDRDNHGLTRGDAAILRLAAAIELIEADLWQQYNELGGAVDHNDNPNPGNPSYTAALANLDSDMPQYISDNTDDEISHAAFLNAYLESKGEEPVSFKAFQTIPPTKATGANQNLARITNLRALNVDTSWYFRYRSTTNPDLGAQFPQLLDIKKQPAIPISDTDTDPNALVPLLQSLPITDPKARRMQAIANTAGLHFAFIEQGGSSLYPILALKATSLEVLRILLSIGGVEIDHFSLWHDKGGNAIAQPLAGPNGLTDPETGLTFPDFNNPANQHNAKLSATDQAAGSQMFQTNLILPEPAQFLSQDLPPVSIIRPTLTRNGGAVATIQAFIADNLFFGQKDPRFLETVFRLAREADAARRDSDAEDGN